jgi:hypothetical protein
MVSASAFAALAGAVSSMAPSLAGVPAITSDAAAGAVQDLKRSKSSSGRVHATSRGDMERLRRRSRKMAKEFQESMEKNVKRKLDNMSGPADNRKLGLKVAQFIPGKGLEIPGAQTETDPSIYCSLGLKSEKLVDPLEETFSRIKGRQVSMDFAFKLIKDKNNVVTHDKKTRVTAFNAFRHVNPDSFNFRKTGWSNAATTTAQKTANSNWHSTLGPDAAPVRRATGGYTSAGNRCGVWRGISNELGVADIGALATVKDAQGNPSAVLGAALQANSLMSPFRYPKDLEIMYSRINRQLMENYGWKLNPFKFVNFSQMTEYDSTREVPNVGSLNVWQDPNDRLMDFNDNDDATEGNLKWSFPANVNNQIKAATSTSPDGGQFEYHSQFGPGKLSYQFQNDGTNPVCIDVCVIGIKKNSPVPIELMKNIFEYNYKVDQRQAAGVTNVNGFQTEDLDSATDTTQPDVLDWTQGNTDWHADAKLPFIPDSCFKNPQSYLDAIDFNPPDLNQGKYAAKEVFEYLEQGKKNPFKLIKRDQFIVSSGSSRVWNTTLPSIKYRPQVYEDVEYPLVPAGYSPQGKLETTADEYTFVLAIGASGLPKPVEEVFPIVADVSDGQSSADFQDTDAKSIVDRQPSTCNVSVVGTYTETIQPAFPKDVSSVNFINGRLTAPYFASAPTSYTPSVNDIAPDRVNTVDIAQLGQVVHTTSNGIVGVGAITTDVGA